jgi:hypothetical protein
VIKLFPSFSSTLFPLFIIARVSKALGKKEKHVCQLPLSILYSLSCPNLQMKTNRRQRSPQLTWTRGCSATDN